MQRKLRRVQHRSAVLRAVHRAYVDAGRRRVHQSAVGGAVRKQGVQALQRQRVVVKLIGWSLINSTINIDVELPTACEANMSASTRTSPTLQCSFTSLNQLHEVWECTRQPHMRWRRYNLEELFRMYWSLTRRRTATELLSSFAVRLEANVSDAENQVPLVTLQCLLVTLQKA